MSVPVNVFQRYFNRINIVSPNDKVHKDECCCSFETAESQGGLYISMHRFEAVSEQFLNYYFERYGDPIYLHHKKRKYRIDKLETEESKPKRLAIGLEGGFNPDATDKNYKTEDIYSIVIFPTGDRYSLPDLNLPDIVLQSYESIVKADSYESSPQQHQTSIWDGEQRIVSKFAENLQQITPARKISPTGWKCDQCDLTENLWLNLTDGSILCGRRFYDGSGGNNHALEHNKQHKYPLSVKLGTITATSADVYSYPEDDFVLDPHLDKHLAHFGIDIQRMVKTEKSILELEIDMNQKLGEWSVIQEEGRNLEPVSGPGFTGLANLGNSCYMNSVLQVLFSLEEFQKRYYPPAEVFNLSSGPSSFNHQMAKLAYGLLSGDYSDIDPTSRSQKGIAPKTFKTFVCGMDRNFGTSRQQDAHEFFLFLMDLVQRNARENRTSEMPSEEMFQRFSSNPTECLEFIIEDRFECSESKKVKYTHRVESCLSLQVDIDLAINMDELIMKQQFKDQTEKTEELQKEVQEKKVEKKPDTPDSDTKVLPRIALSSCIDSFARSETLSDFYSSAIKRRTSAKKSSRIAKFPRYFMFQMKKFQCGADWVPKKMDVLFDVPEILDLDYLEGKGLQKNEELMEDSDSSPTGSTEPQPGTAANEIAQASDPSTSGAQTSSDHSKKDADAPDPEAMGVLLSMGIEESQAITALKMCNNDAQRAIEFIFDPESFTAHHQQHQEEAPTRYVSYATTESRPDRIKLKLALQDDKPKLYHLKAFISHMGTTPMCGHYVCHIKKDERWYIYNDNKVALSENPPKELAYLYLYERFLP